MYNNEFEAYKAVKRDPLLLGKVKNPTLAVCRVAVRELPLALIYVKNKEMYASLAKELAFEYLGKTA